MLLEINKVNIISFDLISKNLNDEVELEGMSFSINENSGWYISFSILKKNNLDYQKILDCLRTTIIEGYIDYKDSILILIFNLIGLLLTMKYLENESKRLPFLL